jgi:tetratricopeptide (TPR) repeat protein
LSPKVAGKYHFQLLAEDWGKLPDSASKRKLDDLINDLPANQREAIATYFRVLGHSKDKEKTKDLFAIARKMDNIERRLELRRSGASDEIELHLQLKELMSSLEREQRTTTSLLQKQFRSDLLEEFNELLDPKQPRKVLKRQMDAITKLEAGIEFGMQRPTLAGRGASVPEFMEVTNRIAKGGDVRQYGRFESFGPDQPLLLSGEITAEQTYRRALRLYQAKAISREEMVRAAQQFEDGRVKATAPLVIYERPPFEYDRTFFTDLLQYAPGLHPTAADIRATLDAEADVEEPKVGKIDADALKLIDKARSTSWLELSVPAEGPIPGYVIRYNGIGQFAYERMLGSGLREQVVCDGTTLWHLYPEIGLVAKRPFSRHHQSLIASINPAYVPAAGELSRGCDVKSVNATTIALIPLRSALGTEYSVLHFVFAADGRLSERRVVEMPSGKTLARQIFSADGSIEWKDKEDKSVAKIARKLDSSKAPELTPNLKDLVVMTMPIRSQEHIVAQARKRGVDPDADHDTTVERFIAACMRGDPYFDKGATMGRLFQNGKERRIGLFTLLHAANASLAVKQLHGPDGKTFSVDFEKVHPNNALAMFLSQCQHEVNHNDPSAYKKVAGPSDGFIQRLSAFRNVWRSWHHQRPIANGGADLPTELSRVIDFLETTPSPVFAYAVLDAMQRRCSRAPSDHMMQIAVKRFAPISHPLGLGYVFRYEEARSLWQAGKGAAAARAFTELHADTVKLGVLPPIDTAFRDVTKTWGDGKFVAFTRKTADELLAQKQYGLTFQLAQQIDKLGDEALRDDILATILDAAPKEDRNALSLISVRYLVDRKSYVQADRILAKVLDDKKLAEHPELWRWRSEIAGNFGQTATSLAALEKALDLEYAELPELVNLESIRTDYRTLLGHYQRIADAHASLDQPAPKEFLAKVVRAADRWRLIDADGSEPCRLAGKIMHTLRQRDLAWDYWTTPIDLHPAESRPWLEFADILQGEGDLERADRAFALAFEAEQTNPEILWKRAQNHVRMGQTSEARRLYRQIVEGTWQERFAVTVEQAKGLAGN